MNNRLFRVLALTVVLGGLPPLIAQHTEVELETVALPSGPLVAPMPDGMAWEVQILRISDLHASALQKLRESGGLNPDLAAAEPRQGSRRIKLEKWRYLNGLLQEETIADDSTSEIVFYSRTKVVSSDQAGELVVEDAASFHEGRSFRLGHFAEFNWIKKENFVGVANYEGRRCLVMREYLSTSPESKTVLRSAFIDETTRLPIALENARGIRKYKFSADTSPLVVPEGLDLLLQQATASQAKRLLRYQISQ